MIARRRILVFCLLLSAALAPLLRAADNSKNDAKDFYDKARKEGADRVKQVQDFCTAAQMEPKNKKYVDECSNNRMGLAQDDTAFLASAIAAYKSHDMARAETQAKQVTSYNSKLYGQAKFLLDRISGERQVEVVKNAWEKGEFNVLLSQAQGITDADFKAQANPFVNNVNLYNGYIDQAHKLKKDNPQEAIKLFAQAENLNSKGPGNPAAAIAELQRSMQAKNIPPPPPTKVVPDSSADTAKKIGKLIADADSKEKQGNLLLALKDYQAALKLQPGDQIVQDNVDRIQQLIKSDPAAAHNELTTAIRYFYQSQFDEAQKALRDYLQSSRSAARNPGVAYFYLGASLVEESMLATPRDSWKGAPTEAQSAFKEARKASYKPVRAYVSPVLLKIWDSTTP